jgi:outer membrane protein OmpA-like peptidoglycan-associated protein
VSACQTLDPYTGEERTSRAAIGAGVGAVIGAVAGAASGDDAKERRNRALIGAGVGALAGGAVGNYMDNKAERLRQKLAGTGVSVTRNGDDIILNMPGNITFQTDSSSLQPGFFAVLDSVGTVLREYDKTIIEVTGHTDSTGARSYNQSLSEQRASTVATYLHNRSIRADRFITVGYGQDRPIADNGTVNGREANRRVAITLVPITQG